MHSGIEAVGVTEPQPPDPPEVSPRLHFYRGQWVGIPILILVIGLALAGILGSKESAAESADDTLRVRVRYPKQLPLGRSGEIHTTLQNVSDRALDSVRVRFDRRFLLRFDQVRFSPAEETASTVVLRDLQPGQSRVLRIELKAQAGGSHRGIVSIEAADGAVTLPLHTRVYP